MIRSYIECLIAIVLYENRLTARLDLSLLVIFGLITLLALAEHVHKQLNCNLNRYERDSFEGAKQRVQSVGSLPSDTHVLQT